jgi:LysM repeat protein
MTPNAPPPPPPRRRYSLWTLLAPGALLVIVILAFNAIGQSCAIKSCDDDKPAASTTSEKTEKADPATTNAEGKPRSTYVVKAGDSGQAIADRFSLTVEDLAACNEQTTDDFYNLTVGERLRVGPFCNGADQRARDKAAADLKANTEP